MSCHRTGYERQNIQHASHPDTLKGRKTKDENYKRVFAEKKEKQNKERSRPSGRDATEDSEKIVGEKKHETLNRTHHHGMGRCVSLETSKHTI